MHYMLPILIFFNAVEKLTTVFCLNDDHLIAAAQTSP